jgi:hypothetical protein
MRASLDELVVEVSRKYLLDEDAELLSEFKTEYGIKIVEEGPTLILQAYGPWEHLKVVEQFSIRSIPFNKSP